MSLTSLNNKNILVTGASSGIGKETAILLSSLGANVIIAGRNAERLTLTFEQLVSTNNNIKLAFDVNDEDAVASIASQLPMIDGIVHAAGIMQTLPFKFINRTAINEIINTNFLSPLFLTQAIVKAKRLNKGASLVFVSSIGGNIIGSKGNLMYSASKGALNAALKVLALEMAPQKIRVNNIAPGMVKTEMWNTENSLFSAEQLADDEKKYPLGYGEPIDVANAAAFLLSDAGKWITGSTLIIDGGFTIQ